eukprot:TRINITY_DN4604_c0_g1_i1.p1 TRINITY_DN4604_c0_g1~~TRINITY_DN4604_c0_g1_i1.p1  ORF type:complete len:155 (+),score=26.62 TRINITY_DN4604_c0_g1_i1:354-818(+)
MWRTLITEGKTASKRIFGGNAPRNQVQANRGTAANAVGFTIFTQFRDLHKGKIKWFNEEKGFGFVTRVSEEGDDVFLQLNGVPESDKFRPLFEGDVIEYDIEEKSKGPIAKNVQVLTRAPRSENGERAQPSEQDKQRAQEYVEFTRTSQGSQSL